jgi:hypothetical protein
MQQGFLPPENRPGRFSRFQKKLISAIIFGGIILLPGLIILIVLGTQNDLVKCEGGCYETLCSAVDGQNYPCRCGSYCEDRRVTPVAYVGIVLIIGGFILAFSASLICCVRTCRNQR